MNYTLNTREIKCLNKFKYILLLENVRHKNYIFDGLETRKMFMLQKLS